MAENAQINVLYVHGMGGGSDSRIPRLLSAWFAEHEPRIRVIARTYSFDPAVAAGQVAAWREELQPALVVGESLGSLHAIRLRGLPHILVSPSLGAPAWFRVLASLTLIPGVPWICGRIWRPREGDRQPLTFRYRILRNYKAHWEAALTNTPAAGSTDTFFAFFGTRDHYRRTGVVRIDTWRKYFGDSFQIYDGTHFMEEEYVYSMLVQRILSILLPGDVR